jgi:hypothetical protein
MPLIEVKLGFVASTSIEVSELVPWNALDPMLVTPAGMAMEVREVASLNALYPMLVSLLS